MNLDTGCTREIINACKRHGALRNQCASILGNIHRETGGMMIPIKETVMAWHKDPHPSDAEVIRRLDRAFAKGQLPWVKTPYWRDGAFGRGLIQITHWSNYDKAGAKLGQPLRSEPDLTLEPEIAIEIAVRGCLEGWFTGKKTGDYCTLETSDFYNARRVVNHIEAADEVAKFSRDYDRALTEDGYGVVDVKQTPVPKGKPKVHKPLTKSKELGLGGGTLLTGLGAWFADLDTRVIVLILLAFAIGVIANRLWARYKDQR